MSWQSGPCKWSKTVGLGSTRSSQTTIEDSVTVRNVLAFKIFPFLRSSSTHYPAVGLLFLILFFFFEYMMF